MATSSEAVLLQIPHVKQKKDDGTLYLMSERLAWIQGNKDVVSISHRYADIKSQKISPEGKPKIQLQVVLHNNATFTFHFVHPEGVSAQLAAREQVKDKLVQLLPKFRVKAGQELENKSRILTENPQLLQLYKDLVTDGIITSEEFWTVHAPQHLQSHKTMQSQSVGVESGFLSGIKSESDGTGIKYNLTPNIIESIFKTYPAVRRKHLDLVPATLTEAQFWTKFFQSHYFHRDRMPDGKDVKDVFFECGRSDDREMRRELEKVKGLKSTVVALMEDEEMPSPDQEVFQNPLNINTGKAQNISATGVLKTMIKRFNQHSIMVLKACDRQASENIEVTSGDTVDGESQPQPKKFKEYLEIEERDFPELQDDADSVSSNVRDLNLVDVDKYLNGPSGQQLTEVIPEEAMAQTWRNMRTYADRWAVKPQLLDAKTAGQVLKELSPGGALMPTHNPNNDTIQTLPPEIESELRNAYISLGELLRHFWNCFPTTTVLLQEKLKKTHEAIKKFEQIKIQQLKDKMIRDHVNYTPVTHISEMINTADKKFQQWLVWYQKTKK